jgi:FtsP/CotA-like multicopper oxidase with cupredoxin domain
VDHARVGLVAIVVVTAGLVPASASLVDPVQEALDASPGPCEDGQEPRTFEIVARQVPISYNKWGDHDPFGRLFIPADKEQEVIDHVSQRLTQAGLDTVARTLEDPGASTLTEIGYGFPDDVGEVPRTEPFKPSDLVEPVTLRAHLGDCVQIQLENKLPESVSLHVHNVISRPGQGMALGDNDPDVTPSGETRTYTVKIPEDPAMEGAHMMHSHADSRYQTKHGLFGALMAEPEGTRWLGPDGSENPTGPMAMIVDPDGPDFREVSLYYHDEIELVDRSFTPLPELSPYGEYGPGSKGINLRSEPFMDRFQHHDELNRRGELPDEHKKSLGLSSYTYGDPPVTPEAYVGDPTKFRLINVGPGQAHVHHLHGGAIRWKMSPVGEDTKIDEGIEKYETGDTHDHHHAEQHPTNPADVNERLDNGEYHPHNERSDVQMLSPGEAFNAEVECGAGGCQASPGDFLFHCHIAEHYEAGMWAIWRTYDTVQSHLAELPDRRGQTPVAVDSTELVGTTLANGTTVTEDNVDDLVERQLPPQGDPDHDDASVWDWAKQDTADGPLYLGEPETERSWPNHEPENPGERYELGFNPENGRLAYPVLKPHLGQRPPFAPGHGPAPYLGEDVAGDAEDRLCPEGARPLNYSIVATGADVGYNDHGDVDEDGMVFAHAENADAVQNGSINPPSLALRANRGDCVDVTLTSQLPEPPGDRRKVNIHTHLVQFDMQATDGSIVGYNYETSVRPAQTTGAGLADPVQAGQTTLPLTRAPEHVHEGALVGVGLTTPDMETRRVAEIDGARIELERPLSEDHEPGERVGSEFVNYRWYPDVELGTVYFHDHVDGLETWRHGLFGALVVEPSDSRWLDPTREEQDPAANEDVLNEHVADVAGPNGTFRELVVTFQDRSAVVDGRSLTSFNLRSEPFDNRQGANPLSSDAHGDPSTDTLRAYPGDPVVVRLLYGGQSTSQGVATFGLTGHRFALEPESPGSHPRDAVSFGISSQHNLQLDCGAGGCDKLPGDYLYYITQPEKFAKGAWGLIRVHEDAQRDLQPLPTNEDWSTGQIPQQADRRFEITALETDVTFNERTDTTDTRKVFVPTEQADAVADDETEPTPLVMRAAAGETIEVELTNRLDEPVSIHAGMVAANATSGDLGIPAGDNGPATVAPGETGTYRWHADRAVGVSHVTSFAEPAEHPQQGLYGALVVEPAGATFDNETGASAEVRLPNGTVIREHVVQYASHDPDFQASVMPYDTAVDGITSVDYRTEPIWNRTGARTPALPTSGEHVGGPGVHTCQVNAEGCTVGAQGKALETGVRHPLNPIAYSSTPHGDPATPVLDAERGQPLVVRAVTGTGEQIQSHTIGGHSWERSPGMHGSPAIDTQTLGTRETADAWIEAAGPGGEGDYLYGSHRDAFREAGAWGLLRVTSSP